MSKTKSEAPSRTASSASASQLESVQTAWTVEGREVFPVAAATYLTFDFNNNPNAILYSQGITLCYFAVLKTEGSNIVTAGHFHMVNNVKESAEKMIASHNSQVKSDKKPVLHLYGGGAQLVGGNTSALKDVIAGAFNKDVEKTVYKRTSFLKNLEYLEVFVAKDSIKCAKTGALNESKQDLVDQEPLTDMEKSIQDKTTKTPYDNYLFERAAKVVVKLPDGLIPLSDMRDVHNEFQKAQSKKQMAK